MIDPPNHKSEPARGRHLDTTALSAIIDGTMPPAERSAADAHLAECSACRRELAELRATVQLLHGLPQYRPRRSFALTPEQARQGTGLRSWLGRLTPGMAILRAATILVAVALLAVIAGDAISHSTSGGSQPGAGHRGGAITTARQPAGTKPTPPSSSYQNAAVPAPTRPANAAPAAAAPATTPPSVLAVAPHRATPAAASGSGSGAGKGSVGHHRPSSWRIAEIALGVSLFWLIVSWVGVTRMRGHAPRS